MNKIIPFKKEIKFDDNIYEITSISLEHNLHKEDKNILGNFTISGEYRMTETSINTLYFSYDLPFTIDVADKYNIDNATIDIDDFYYEIEDNKYLNISIDVKLDKIEEIILEEVRNEENDMEELEELSCIEEDDDIIPMREEQEEIKEIKEEKIQVTEEVKSLFANIEKEEYVTYKVYIVREGDTIDSIMTKYNITKDIVLEYNDLSNVQIGDKIIIPYVKN